MSELLKKLEREVLPLIERPSRYIGGERNVPRKDSGDVALRFLLAFPDVYEIGMSHLGIRVLYDILNQRADIAAERCFAPWMDMERLMREKGVPLFSVETTTPAREFDIIGFTLQYELHFTNILTMLDLAGVPLRAAERTDDDPLVVGGGPGAANPEPVAPFFDLFVVGDGESAVLELSDLVVGAREDGVSREELLGRAAALEGVYVPSIHGPGGPSVRRRAEERLGFAMCPSAPIVPVTETTHDRLAIEIMRGCTRGCRFCQPGMITRPVRMRPVDDVVRLVDEGLAGSGYDEVSLVSLSTSDHDGLPELMSRLNERLFDRKVSVSLPSLRVDRFGLELADSIARVRRSGLTFAPEAGTQRLRDVINKNETEENILRTVDTAFASGWKRIKLYFMIGLPTETRADLEGIVDLVAKVRETARKRRKGAGLSVSISPFVPRAHTPFQWERQDSSDETREKEQFLRSELRRFKGIKLATRDPNVSFLEGVMARGDRRLAPVIERAWRDGARFDGWTEAFKFETWRRAFEAEGVEAAGFLDERPVDETLPWEHLDAGPSRTFLLAERERALRGESTPDCREEGCHACGACTPELLEAAGIRPEGSPEARPADTVRPPANGATQTYGRRERKVLRTNGSGATRWRVRYAKERRVRFLSHLDIVRTVLRALSMSGISVTHTQGFNPHPKLSFGPPLPVGSTGEAEFFDLETTRAVEAREIESRLGAGLPEGLALLSVRPATSKLSASAVAEAAEYLIVGVPGLEALDASELAERMTSVRKIQEIEVPKGKSMKTIRPRDQILELEVAGQDPLTLRAVLAVGKEGSVRPVDVVRLLGVDGAGPPELAEIHRTALLTRPIAGAGGLEQVR